MAYTTLHRWPIHETGVVAAETFEDVVGGIPATAVGLDGDEGQDPGVLLNGTDEWLDVDASLLSVDWSGSWSITMWVNILEQGADDFMWAFGNTADANSFIGMQVITADESIRAYFDTDAGSRVGYSYGTGGNDDHNVENAGDVFVAVTHDASGEKFRIWMSKSDASSMFGGHDDPMTYDTITLDTFYIGKRFAAPQKPVSGTYWDIRISEGMPSEAELLEIKDDWEYVSASAVESIEADGEDFNHLVVDTDDNVFDLTVGT